MSSRKRDSSGEDTDESSFYKRRKQAEQGLHDQPLDGYYSSSTTTSPHEEIETSSLTSPEDDGDNIRISESEGEDGEILKKVVVEEEEEEEEMEVVDGEQVNEEQLVNPPTISTTPANTPATMAGKLKSVQMINFMCHSNLTINFGPRMNFVVGRNGSGKSAVLTAIIMGLGGRASDTNRAHGIGDAVKEGEQKASIKITFENSGLGAFRPDIYGSSFTIERAISRLDKVGQSNYNIYPHNGKKIKCSRKDLEDILTQFSIDIDNQFAMLTQDQARSFLVAKKPSHKFELLMRGLRINQSLALNSVASNNLSITKSNLESKEGELERLRKTQEEWEAKKNLNKKVEETSRLQTYYKSMGLWAKYDKRRSKIKELEDRNQSLREEITAKQSEVDNLAANAEKMKEDSMSWINSKTNLTGKIKKLDEEMEAARRECLDLEDQLTRLKQNESSINHQKNTNEANKAELEAELLKLTSSEGGQSFLQGELDTVNEKISQLEEEEANLRLQRDSNLSAIGEAENNLDELKQKVHPLESRLRSEKAQLKELNEGEVSIDDAYGPNMTRVLKEIEGNRSFHSRPIGPLGRYVSLKLPEWSSLLEHNLRHTLSSFWTRDPHDRNILLEILEKYRMTNTVIVKDIDIFDYTSSCPDPQYTTALDALEIKDEGIKRLFIDQHNLHKILLIEDRAEADRVMYTRPINALCAYARQMRKRDGSASRDGFQIGSSIAGASSSIFLRGTPVNQPTKMIVDTGYRKREIEQSISECELQLRQINEEIRVAQPILVNAKDIDKRITRQFTSLNRRSKTLDEERDNLQTQLDELTDNSKVLHLQGEIESCEQRISNYDIQFVSIRQAYKDKGEEVKQAKDIIASLQHHSSDIMKQLHDIENSVERQSRVEADLMANRDAALSCIRDFNLQITRNDKEIVELEKSAATFKQHASFCSPEPVPLEEGMTTDDIIRQIRLLGERMRALEKESGFTLDEVMEKYTLASNAYSRAKRESVRMNSIYDKLAKTSESHQRTYKNIIQHVFSMIKSNFRHNLGQRGFNGKLEIDEARQELRLNIDPIRSAVRRNVETLSGGEKSFSQIALLISIWQAMPTTLLALDEFDVFMDNANRKQSLQMVIDSLRKKYNTQSIIITPQDMDLNEEDLNSDDITIQRMPDPVRRVVGNV